MTIEQYKKSWNERLEKQDAKDFYRQLGLEASLLTRKQKQALFMLSQGEPWDSVSYFVDLSPGLMKVWLTNEDFHRMLDIHAPVQAGTIDGMTFTKLEEQQFLLGELIKREYKTVELRGLECQNDGAPEFTHLGLMMRDVKKVGNSVQEIWKKDSSSTNTIERLITLQAKLSGTLEAGEDADLNEVNEIVISLATRDDLPKSSANDA